jgi:hypothetical protein
VREKGSRAVGHRLVPIGNHEAVDAAVLAQQADALFEERCCDEAIAS